MLTVHSPLRFLFLASLLGFAAPVRAAWKASDLRNPELMDRKSAQPVALDGDLKASLNAETVLVRIPGRYADSLFGFPHKTLPMLLAATAVAGACATDVKDPAALIDVAYRGKKTVTQPWGDAVTEYTFEFQKGRVANVTVEIDGASGLVAAIRSPKGK